MSPLVSRVLFSHHPLCAVGGALVDEMLLPTLSYTFKPHLEAQQVSLSIGEHVVAAGGEGEGDHPRGGGSVLTPPLPRFPEVPAAMGMKTSLGTTLFFLWASGRITPTHAIA